MTMPFDFAEDDNLYRFNLDAHVSEIMKTITIAVDDEVRARLIDLGWTPPPSGTKNAALCFGCRKIVPRKSDGDMENHIDSRTRALCFFSGKRGGSIGEFDFTQD